MNIEQSPVIPAAENREETDEQIIEQLYQLHKSWKESERDAAAIGSNINTIEQHRNDADALQNTKERQSSARIALERYLYDLDDPAKKQRPRKKLLYAQAVERYENETKHQPYRSITEKYTTANDGGEAAA